MLVAGAAWLLLSVACAPPIGPAGQAQGVSPASSTACVRARDERSEASRLLASGRLLGARRLLDAARERCRGEAEQGWADELTVLAALGRTRELGRLRERVEARGEASPALVAALERAEEASGRDEARPTDDDAEAAMRVVLATADDAERAGDRVRAATLYAEAVARFRPNGAGLLGAARVAAASGETVAAARLASRAVVELEDASDESLGVVPPRRGPSFFVGIGGGLVAIEERDKPRGSPWPLTVTLAPLAEPWAPRLRVEGYDECRLSPTGRVLAVQTARSQTELVDAWSGAVRATVDGSGPYAFSPDGRLLSTLREGEALTVFDAETGAERSVVPATGDRPPLFAPDGRSLLVPDGVTPVGVWDLTRAPPVQRARLAGSGAELLALTLSRDGALVASARADDAAVRLWDLATGAPHGVLRTFDADADALAFSPDGALLGGSVSGALWLWEVATGRLRHVIEHCAAPFAFAPDSARVACSDDGVALVDLATCSAERSLPLRAHPLAELAFSADGRVLVAAETELDHGAVRLWDSESGALRAELAPTPPLVWLQEAAEGSLLFALDGPRRVRRWDLRRGGELPGVLASAPLRALGASATGDRLALVVGEHALELFDAGSQTRIETPPWFSWGAPALTTDGRVLLVGDGDRVWSSQPAAAAPLVEVAIRARGGVGDHLFSPDGRLLALGGEGGDVEVWDTAGATRLGSYALALAPAWDRFPGAFSRDGWLLALGGERGEAWLVELASGVVHELSRAREGRGARAVHRLAIDPEGELVALAPELAPPEVWDWAHDRLRAVVAGHDEGAADLAFAGGALVVSSDDGQLSFHRGPAFAPAAALFPLAGAAASAVVAGDAVEIVGPDAARAEAAVQCRVGSVLVPFATCRQELETPGLLLRALGRRAGAADEPLRADVAADAAVGATGPLPRDAFEGAPRPAAPRCVDGQTALAWREERAPTFDACVYHDDAAARWPSLTPAETEALLGPVVMRVRDALSDAGVQRLATLVHPALGLALDGDLKLSARAMVPSLGMASSDCEGAPTTLGAYLEDEVAAGIDWSLPRIVSQSRLLPGVSVSCGSGNDLAAQHPGRPFVQLRRRADEIERGAGHELVLVFERWKDAWRLVGLHVLADRGCG